MKLTLKRIETVCNEWDDPEKSRFIRKKYFALAGQAGFGLKDQREYAVLIHKPERVNFISVKVNDTEGVEFRTMKQFMDFVAGFGSVTINGKGEITLNEV